MKSMSVREFRNTMPRLRETLAAEGELLLVSNGQPLARVLPLEPPTPMAPRRLPSLAAFRATMPMSKTPIEDMISEERNRR